jgi:hypothetical protein
MAKDLLFKLRSVTLSNEKRRRDIAAELEARGHLNERGKTFAANTFDGAQRDVVKVCALQATHAQPPAAVGSGKKIGSPTVTARRDAGSAAPRGLGAISRALLNVCLTA